MAGYPSTPLARKLDIGTGHRVRSVGTPLGVDLAALLAPVPDDVDLDPDPGLVDRVLLWCDDAEQLRSRLPTALTWIPANGAVWVVWPKKSSDRWRSGPRDITEDVVRGHALELGVVDVKVCAVDATWSGLKLVRWLRDR